MDADGNMMLEVSPPGDKNSELIDIGITQLKLLIERWENNVVLYFQNKCTNCDLENKILFHNNTFNTYDPSLIANVKNNNEALVVIPKGYKFVDKVGYLTSETNGGLGKTNSDALKVFDAYKDIAENYYYNPYSSSRYTMGITHMNTIFHNNTTIYRNSPVSFIYSNIFFSNKNYKVQENGSTYCYDYSNNPYDPRPGKKLGVFFPLMLSVHELMHAWTKNTGDFINSTCNAICHNAPCGKWCGNKSEECNQLGKNWQYCLFRYYENSDDFGQTDPWCGDNGVGGFYKKQADNFNICDRHKQIMMNALGIQN